MSTQLPETIKYGKVIGRFVLGVGDTDDADHYPDKVVAEGKITFTPANIITKETLATPPTTVIRKPIPCTLDEDGDLVDPEGIKGVWLTTGVWKVAYALTGATVPGHDILVLEENGAENPIDLTKALPPGGPVLNASQYAELSARINSITVASETKAQINALVLPENPEEGITISALIDETTVIPSGITWDSGGEPTVTGRLLIACVWSGVDWVCTYGLPIAAAPEPTDTTAPTWSATFTMGTPTQTSVVATASAMATDDTAVTGYEVSYNGGTSWAPITPSGSNFTLTGTAGTTYSNTRLRARDAAGNRSTPALNVPSYTMAASTDVTPPTPGTLASSSITDTTFTLTVSGASDETALHATPYAFSTDNGSNWSAYQAGASFDATGLTAETEYTCVHRVRDSAGNVATGSSIAVETAAASAAFVDTFSDGTGSAPPAGWTQEWGSVDSWDEEAGHIAIDRTAPGRWAISLDAAGDIAGDVDVVMKAQCSVINGSSTAYAAGLIVGGGGSAASETGIVAYMAGINAQPIPVVRTTIYNAGASSNLINYTASNWAAHADEVYVRLNISGTTARVRAWSTSASEPATWDGTFTCPAPSGFVGIFHGGNADSEVRYFAVSASGPAPLES